MRRTPEDRFAAKVMPEPNSGCWLWTGQIDRDGYGLFWNGDRMVLAHRFAYELHKGPIPKGLQIDHTCSIRCCVNPDHLEVVTPQENVRRTWVRGRGNNGQLAKTHCPAGHPYAGDNLYRAPDGRRYCRACNARYDREYRKRRTARALGKQPVSESPAGAVQRKMREL